MTDQTCKLCGGNDQDMPCAYTTEKPDGCLRVKRMTDHKQNFIDEVMRLAVIAAFPGRDENHHDGLSKLKAFMQERIGEPVNVDGIGKWLSAALEDSNVCTEMKTDIEHWLELTSIPLYRLDGEQK